MPNPAQYEHKLEAYTEGKDPRAMQADAPRILAELIEGVPELALRQRPLPDEWSVGEIIAHLAEDEVAQQLAVSADHRKQRMCAFSIRPRRVGAAWQLCILGTGGFAAIVSAFARSKSTHV